MKEIKNGLCEESVLAQEENIALQMALDSGNDKKENPEESEE